MKSKPARIIAFFSLLGLVSVAIGAQTFAEYPIPTANSDVQSLTLGPDGAIWFTERIAYKIGRIDDAGVITEFPVPAAVERPLQITTGPDGNLWFTSLTRIWKLTPSGAFTEFPLPPAQGAGRITAGSDGNVWFEGSDATNPNAPLAQIGRITPSGVVTQFPLPTPSVRVPDMTLGSDGNVWFTESGFALRNVARITPAGVVTEFPLPPRDATPTAIAAGSDGNLWFLEEPNTDGAEAVGRMTTGGAVTYFPLAQAPRDSYITSAPDGTMWFSNSLPGQLAQLRTSGDVTYHAPPTPNSVLAGVAAGADGSIWFAEKTANKVGRLSFGSTPCTPDATTLCLNNNRFRVTADWRKTDSTTGHGTGIQLTSDSGYFWFFNAANIELVVKVLNACSLNPPHYWVFAAGLTNVEVTMTVTDTQTGESKPYTNPLGTAFVPIQDTSAFATCP